jgi:hypothetical protein
MVEDEKDKPQAAEQKSLQSSSPLIFISHDSRDAELAAAFSELLGSVSSGMLESFRSSDKKGTEGNGTVMRKSLSQHKLRATCFLGLSG